MELVLLRHGETEYNRADLFRGRKDLPLNDRGRKQARAAADYLDSYPFEAFYSSPLLRAMQTASEVAAPHDGQVNPLDYFIDVDYGQWSGKSFQEVKTTWPREFSLWADDPARVVFPGGESMAMVRKRLEAGLDGLAEDHEHMVLLVGHKVINRLVLCIILGLPTSGIWKVEQSNGAINLITRENGRWMLQRMNDICHLVGIASNEQLT
jgi:broad specificity phosphatase PhoE